MKNWKTTLGSVMTAISLVPAGLAYLNMADMPVIVQQIGAICAFISFIWTGMQAKDKNVTGVGEDAKTKAEVQSILGTDRPNDR